MLVKVRAHPGSSSLRLRWQGGVLSVYLTEPAEKGKANAQLQAFLAKEFGSCRLVKGAGSRNKLVELPTSLNRLENHV